MNTRDEGRHRLTEEDRLQKYFWDLERAIPNPPKNWAVNAKPCKWAKMLEENKLAHGREEEARTLCQRECKEGTDQSWERREDEEAGRQRRPYRPSLEAIRKNCQKTKEEII